MSKTLGEMAYLVAMVWAPLVQAVRPRPRRWSVSLESPRQRTRTKPPVACQSPAAHLLQTQHPRPHIPHRARGGGARTQSPVVVEEALRCLLLRSQAAARPSPLMCSALRCAGVAEVVAAAAMASWRGQVSVVAVAVGVAESAACSVKVRAGPRPAFGPAAGGLAGALYPCHHCPNCAPTHGHMDKALTRRMTPSIEQQARVDQQDLPFSL